jgi:hypothetical protein
MGVVILAALIFYLLVKKNILVLGKELRRQRSAKARSVNEAEVVDKSFLPHHLDSAALSELDGR